MWGIIANSTIGKLCWLEESENDNEIFLIEESINITSFFCNINENIIVKIILP